MPTSSGARSQILYKAQTAFGTTATGNYTIARWARHNLRAARDTIEDDSIRSDRQVPSDIPGAKSAVGEIEVNLAPADHDWLLTGVLFGAAFAGGPPQTTTIGLTPTFYSIEDGALDIARYRLFTSCMINTMSLRCQPNGLGRATFGIIGSDGGNLGTTGGGTPVASGTGEVYNTFSGDVLPTGDGSGTALATITGFDLNIDNSGGVIHTIGDAAAVDVEFGRCLVTGEITARFIDGTFFTDFLAGTPVGLTLKLANQTGNTLEFRMPRCTYREARAPVQDERGRMVTLPFQASVGGSTTTAITLAKT